MTSAPPRKIPIVQVDAFTSRAFRGNPAAVCLLEEPLDDDSLMLAIAAEMNLSETAFVHPANSGPVSEGMSRFKLRWFTPTVEVQLCGHATLATASVLFERVGAVDALHFETRSGELRAARKAGDGGAIQLDFPADPITISEAPSDLVYALGIDEHHTYAVARSRHAMIHIEPGRVRSITPDFEALRTACDTQDISSIVVTSEDDRGEFDFISRFFGPSVGVNEDPVTGAAHCMLGPYWAEKLGRTSLRAHQASRRGGELEVEVRSERVLLMGNAVTVLRGELLIPG